MNWPNKIQKVRLHLRESQTEFGNRFNVSHAAVSDWESDKSEAPYKVIDFVINAMEDAAMGKFENNYYTIHYKSGTVSFWEICHTLAEVHQFLKSREDTLSGVELTIKQEYGWDEQERKELARLKAKYEPESKS